MKIFYHNDPDGESSAGIVKTFCEKQKIKKLNFISVDYRIPFPVKKVEYDEFVVILDFTMDKIEEWEKLLKKTEHIIWIDHHKSCLDEKNPHHLNGIRRVGNAACALTWEFFYPDKNIPRAIELVEDFDIWKFKYPETMNFQYGLKAYDTNPNTNFWDYLIYSDDNEEIMKICEQGIPIKKAEDKRLKKLIKEFVYNVKFEGMICNCINAKEYSLVFDNIQIPSTDIQICWIFDGRNYEVHMYSKNKNIDLSEIAQKYGGGGHVGAAGFVINKLPFEKV